MIELGVIAFLSGVIAWQEYNNRKERAKMLNMIVSKNNQDLVNLELADKTTIKPQTTNTDNEWLPVDALSDEEYKKIITKNINKNA